MPLRRRRKEKVEVCSDIDLNLNDPSLGLVEGKRRREEKFIKNKTFFLFGGSMTKGNKRNLKGKKRKIKLSPSFTFPKQSCKPLGDVYVKIKENYTR